MVSLTHSHFLWIQRVCLQKTLQPVGGSEAKKPYNTTEAKKWILSSFRSKTTTHFFKKNIYKQFVHGCSTSTLVLIKRGPTFRKETMFASRTTRKRGLPRRPSGKRCPCSRLGGFEVIFLTNLVVLHGFTWFYQLHGDSTCFYESRFLTDYMILLKEFATS